MHPFYSTVFVLLYCDIFILLLGLTCCCDPYIFDPIYPIRIETLNGSDHLG